MRAAVIAVVGRPTARAPAGPCETLRMNMDIVGWIFVGFLAGSISGWFVGTRSTQGCVPTIVVGIMGGIIGGWLSREIGMGQVEGFIGALVFATIGAIVVRLLLRAIEGGR
jgi:uncharacterized membrane protein YeaQ/YmgE (transglycosylase-associated protein family)